MREINGFEIEQYNVHGIKDRAKTSTCPSCSEHRKKKNDKCMSVFWDTGLGQCNHCGETVQLHTYTKKDSVKVYKRPIYKAESKYSETVLKWFKDQRGISEKTLIDGKISEGRRWMPKAKAEINVIEFNYYFLGELINVKSRGKNKDFIFEKDCELIMFGLDDILNQNEAVLVEGEPDKLAYLESGVKNCASVPNGFTLPRPDGSSSINLNYLDDYIGIFENIDKIYLAFDNDAAGQEGTKEFIRRLGAEKCHLVDFKDCKDANDYLKKYGPEELKQTLSLAKMVPLEDVKSINDVRAELEDFWINGAPRGMTVDLEGFDNAASFVMKQHTLIVAAPGSGKSDLADHFTARLAVKYGDKVGICSTENKPIHFHYDKIFRKINGLRPTAETIKSKRVTDCMEFVQDHFFVVDMEGRNFLEDVLSKFAELVKRKGCRWFVIDPYNKVSLKNFSKSDINAYTAEYHQQLDAFEQKYDCHIFLVAHPVKLPLKEGSTKTYIMPTAYHIKGGGEHFDMSYNIIGIVRDHERNIVNVRTLKWKFQHLGTMGQDFFFGWNINNGRYTKLDGVFEESDTTVPSVTWKNNSWLDKFGHTEPLPDKKEEAMQPNEEFETSESDDWLNTEEKWD
tara:strand:+ start:934 stop:2802 length:1869 start_codon:yes stop_codon:yes gene_type:complete